MKNKVLVFNVINNNFSVSGRRLGAMVSVGSVNNGTELRVTAVNATQENCVWWLAVRSDGKLHLEKIDKIYGHAATVAGRHEAFEFLLLVSCGGEAHIAAYADTMGNKEPTDTLKRHALSRLSETAAIKISAEKNTAEADTDEAVYQTDTPAIRNEYEGLDVNGKSEKLNINAVINESERFNINGDSQRLDIAGGTDTLAAISQTDRQSDNRITQAEPEKLDVDTAINESERLDANEKSEKSAEILQIDKEADTPAATSQTDTLLGVNTVINKSEKLDIAEETDALISGDETEIFAEREIETVISSDIFDDVYKDAPEIGEAVRVFIPSRDGGDWGALAEQVAISESRAYADSPQSPHTAYNTNKDAVQDGNMHTTDRQNENMRDCTAQEYTRKDTTQAYKTKGDTVQDRDGSGGSGFEYRRQAGLEPLIPMNDNDAAAETAESREIGNPTVEGRENTYSGKADYEEWARLVNYDPAEDNAAYGRPQHTAAVNSHESNSAKIAEQNRTGLPLHRETENADGYKSGLADNFGAVSSGSGKINVAEPPAPRNGERYNSPPAPRKNRLFDEPQEYDGYIAGTGNYYREEMSDADIVELINCCEDGKDRISTFSDTLDKAAKDGGKYYARVKKQLHSIFEKYEPYEPLVRQIKDSYWVKISYKDNFYAIGLVLESLAPAYICYALSADSVKSADDSFICLAGNPAHFILAQNADSGKIEKPAFALNED